MSSSRFMRLRVGVETAEVGGREADLLPLLELLQEGKMALPDVLRLHKILICSQTARLQLLHNRSGAGLQQLLQLFTSIDGDTSLLLAAADILLTVSESSELREPLAQIFGTYLVTYLSSAHLGLQLRVVQVLHNLLLHPQAAGSLLPLGLVPELASLLTVQHWRLQSCALHALCAVCSHGHVYRNSALDCGALQTVAGLLSSVDEEDPEAVVEVVEAAASFLWLSADLLSSQQAAHIISCLQPHLHLQRDRLLLCYIRFSCAFGLLDQCSVETGVRLACSRHWVRHEVYSCLRLRADAGSVSESTRPLLCHLFACLPQESAATAVAGCTFLHQFLEVLCLSEARVASVLTALLNSDQKAPAALHFALKYTEAQVGVHGKVLWREETLFCAQIRKLADRFSEAKLLLDYLQV